MADNKPRASIHVGKDKKSFSPQVSNEAERRELFLSWWLQRMRGSAYQLGWNKEARIRSTRKEEKYVKIITYVSEGITDVGSWYSLLSSFVVNTIKIPYKYHKDTINYGIFMVSVWCLIRIFIGFTSFSERRLSLAMACRLREDCFFQFEV